jgi:hypothetical protein
MGRPKIEMDAQMKILVCGGREYADKEFLYGFLDNLPLGLKVGDVPPVLTHLIHGDARGADHLAHGWAVMRGVQPVRVPALWDLYGLKAGVMRNISMLALNPDVVVAFPGGRGTAHMVHIAQRKGVRVICVGDWWPRKHLEAVKI